MTERRQAWFSSKGQAAITLTLLLQLFAGLYYYGRLTEKVDNVSDRLHRIELFLDARK